MAEEGLTRLRKWLLANTLLLTSSALAAAPLPSAFCGDDQIVDKERLALAALADAGVSAYPFRWASTHELPTGRSPAQHLLIEESFCSDEPAMEKGVPRCGKQDADKLKTARNLVLNVLLDDGTTFQNGSSARTVRAYFASTSSSVKCVSSSTSLASTPTNEYPAPFSFKKVPLRLRGSTDGLQFDRDLDTAFTGIDKAVFNFKSDKAKGKDTRSASAVLGLVLKPVPAVFEVVPYVGYVTDTSKKNGEAEEVTSKAWRLGTLLDFRTRTAEAAHLFLLRPEYAWNRKDRSEILTGTFTYQPIVNGYLNSARNIALDDRSLVTIVPRADLRLVGGHFTKQGDRSDPESQDFLRAGAQIGVTFSSDVKWLPVELTVTETYLIAVSGRKYDLSHLKSVFSIYFDERKYFGVDLGYARGRRDDLLEREENWTAGLAAKF